MFGFLKDKLKEAVRKLTKDVNEQAAETVEPTYPEKAEAAEVEIPAEKKPWREAAARAKPKTTRKKEAIPEGLESEERKEREPAGIPEEADVLAKIEKEEEQQEERKVGRIIGSIEEETKPKGFFDRIKGVFSPREHEKEGEEGIIAQEIITHQPLGEPLGKGLTTEETEFIGKHAGEEEKEEAKEESLGQMEKPEEERGFFTKLARAVTTKTITEKQFDEIFWDLEVALLEANVAVEVIEKIKTDLKTSLVGSNLPRSKVGHVITATLARSMEGLFDIPAIRILDRVKEKKPYVIAFFGINGAGKTTTIAKIAHYLKKNGMSVVFAAGDTFRAAAIQQLEEHADRLGVKVIRHDYGADAAAVGFDAIKYAESKKIDAVLIDTAGRMHSNVNLMDELAKIIRVCKPDLRLFVGESITGNDCIEQARQFNDAVGIDGIILTKADVDEKGGAAVSVSYVTKKPILFLGTGQGYDDLQLFEKRAVLGSLGLA